MKEKIQKYCRKAGNLFIVIKRTVIINHAAYI